MAFYTQTEKYSVSERLLAGFALLLERAAARHAHHRIYRNTLAELRTLSDRDLTDLGLNRSMLKQVALDAADKQVNL